MILEEWKEIDGLEGEYAISTKGRVKNLKTNRIIGRGYDTAGYRFVNLKGKSYYIHRLVALAFLDNPNNLPQVNHIDEVKTNNNVENLEWVSASQNVRHSAHQYSCNINQLTLDGQFIRQWESSHQINRETGYNQGYIIQCCRGKYKQAYNFRWEYAKLDSQRVFNRPVIVFKGSEHIGTFPSIKKASEALGLSYMSVYHCLQGHLNSNKGFTFKYLE